MIRPQYTLPNAKRVIIVGCGRVGIAVATGLAEKGFSVRMLDVDPEAFELLPSGHLDGDRITPITGDGTLEADLMRAGIADAEALVAVTGSDNVNALAALAATRVFGVGSAICRIDDPDKQQAYSSLGLTAVSATILLAERLVDSVAN